MLILFRYMKLTIRHIFIAAAVLSLAACTRETELDSGNDVHFTVTAVRAVAPDTRTVYNDGLLPDGAVSLCWQAGDRVSIWSPEAGVYDAGSYPHLAASYRINGQDPSYGYGKATGVSRVASGLEWGTSDTHTFYGRYPDPTWTSSAPYAASDAFKNQDLASSTFTCWLPRQVSVTPATGVYDYTEDMTYCYMTAYASAPRNSTVSMDFEPAVTVFRINISVPDDMTDLTVSRVSLSALSSRLNGEFTVGIASERNFTVSSAGWNSSLKEVAMQFTSPVTVPSGQVLRVTLFACPVTAQSLTLTLTCDDCERYLSLEGTDGGSLSFPPAKFYDIYCGDVKYPDPDSPASFTPHMFSVGDGEWVYFSPGNLQLVGENSWQFAGQQLDYFGSEQSDNHRDLFGWGTGNAPNMVSTSSGDYASFADWGSHTISNGGDYAWRTLTTAEWQHLFARRDRDGHKLFAAATVLDVPGIILFPDDYCPGISFTDGAEHYSDNEIDDATEWSLLESFGCVFLPAAGGRNGSGISGVGQRGAYWSGSANGSGSAFLLDFTDGSISPGADDYRYCGASVRLVRGQYQFSVAEGKKVAFAPGNLKYEHDYNNSTWNWGFMEHQYDLSEEEGVDVYDNYGDWSVETLFGWATSGYGGIEPNRTIAPDHEYYEYIEYGPSISFGEWTSRSAEWDWGVHNNIPNDGDFTWRTLTKAEWMYVLGSRNSSPRYAQATVAGVGGLIIFPDNYAHPSGVAAINNADSACTGYADNTFDAATWSVLEGVGCVFLPAAGRRGETSGTVVYNVGVEGGYWSSTANGRTGAYHLSFSGGNVTPDNTSLRRNGLSVRLARDL